MSVHTDINYHGVAKVKLTRHETGSTGWWNLSLLDAKGNECANMSFFGPAQMAPEIDVTDKAENPLTDPA